MSFDQNVIKQLGYYVYRLVDPRNGNTFYVGKGKGNRVFNHVNFQIPDNEYDQASDKYNIIREIKNSGLEVVHVIHRHGMTEKTALEVESALIDAYPGLSNLILGHGSNDFGVMSTTQLINLYSLKEADFANQNLKFIIITINESLDNRNIYDATRYAWRVDLNKAEKADYVLSSDRGKIVGIFKPTKWMDAKVSEFPFAVSDMEGRYGFEGDEVTGELREKYLNTKVPKIYRSTGYPVRYVNF